MCINIRFLAISRYLCSRMTDPYCFEMSRSLIKHIFVDPMYLCHDVMNSCKVKKCDRSTKPLRPLILVYSVALCRAQAANNATL